MADKPTLFPEWATTLAADPTSGQNNRVEPSAGQKDTGIEYTDRLHPRQYINYQLWLINQWVEYLESTVNQNIIPPITTGTATVYAAVLDITAYETNRVYEVQIHLDNTGACTVDLGPSAASVKLLDGNDPHAVALKDGMIAKFLYDATNLILLNPESPDISGYVKGTTEYLEGDVGVNSTTFAAASVIGAAWESIGPSGSGATNIWTALEDAPSGAKFIKLKIIEAISGSTNGDTYKGIVYLRKTGSSAAADLVSQAGEVSFTNTSGSLESSSDITRDEIPVDSLIRFDAYLVANGTSPAQTANLYYKGTVL